MGLNRQENKVKSKNMEVSQKLQVGAKPFFDALATSVAYDVSQAVGKKVSPSQLYSGYRYTKKLKNKVKQVGDVQVTIKQFTSPVGYEASFRSSQGTNFISYQIEDLGDGSIIVHYSEGFTGDSTMKTLNHKIVSTLYNPGAKKRMTRMLLSMEQFVNSQENKS